jgi:hypothetical protein
MASVVIAGDVSGTCTLQAANAAGTTVLTLPTSSGVLVSTTTPLNASSITSGTLAVSYGGTGANTLTGVLKGNGTSAFTAAVAGTDFVSPGGALGTPSSGTLTNCTGYSASNLASGTLPAARLPAGSVLQVVQTVLTSTASVSSSTFAAISGFTVSITPTSATSRILILTSLQGGNNGNNCTVVLTRNGSNICFADAASNRTQGTAAAQNFQVSQACSITMNFLDSPATTSAVTYGVSASMNAGTFFINRTSRDNDATNIDARYASTIIAMEIAA